jgi:hypothetical protein
MSNMFGHVSYDTADKNYTVLPPRSLFDQILLPHFAFSAGILI